MIFGVGTDIIEIKRVEKAIESKRFLEKCFTSNEIALIEKKGIQSAAGNFAGKESVAKCFGTGFSGFKISEIEILRDGYGKPYVNLTGKALELSEKLMIKSIHISISHSEDYAVAYAVAEV